MAVVKNFFSAQDTFSANMQIDRQSLIPYKINAEVKVGGAYLACRNMIYLSFMPIFREHRSLHLLIAESRHQFQSMNALDSRERNEWSMEKTS